MHAIGLLPLGLLSLLFVVLPGSSPAAAVEVGGAKGSELEDVPVQNMSPSVNRSECTSTDSIEVLHNDEGQTPCTVANSIISKCHARIASDTSNPSSSDYAQCECNTVMYNLLGACYRCRDEAMPNFSNWISNCTSSKTNVTCGGYPAAQIQDTAGVNIPNWAYVNVAQDGSFDLAAAIQTANKHWTPMQIATPIIVAAVLLLLFAGIFFWYRRRHQRENSKPKPKPKVTGNVVNAHIHGNRFLGVFSRIQRVHSHERLASWAIDADEPDAERPPRRNSDDSSRSSSPELNGRIKTTNGVIKSFTWPFKKPVPVQSVPRRGGFRIDDRDESSQGHGSVPVYLERDIEAAMATEGSFRGSKSRLSEREPEEAGEEDHEMSVLLIARRSEADFETGTVATVDVNVIPPTPHSSRAPTEVHSHRHSSHPPPMPPPYSYPPTPPPERASPLPSHHHHSPRSSPTPNDHDRLSPTRPGTASPTVYAYPTPTHSRDVSSQTQTSYHSSSSNLVPNRPGASSPYPESFVTARSRDVVSPTPSSSSLVPNRRGATSPYVDPFATPTHSRNVSSETIYSQRYAFPPGDLLADRGR